MGDRTDWSGSSERMSSCAVKHLTEPADIRAIIAFEEAHKDGHGVVSAAQTRLAGVAKEIVGID